MLYHVTRKAQKVMIIVHCIDWKLATYWDQSCTSIRQRWEGWQRGPVESEDAKKDEKDGCEEQEKEVGSNHKWERDCKPCTRSERGTNEWHKSWPYKNQARNYKEKALSLLPKSRPRYGTVPRMDRQIETLLQMRIRGTLHQWLQDYRTPRYLILFHLKCVCYLSLLANRSLPFCQVFYMWRGWSFI